MLAEDKLNLELVNVHTLPSYSSSLLPLPFLSSSLLLFPIYFSVCFILFYLLHLSLPPFINPFVPLSSFFFSPSISCFLSSSFHFLHFYLSVPFILLSTHLSIYILCAFLFSLFLLLSSYLIIYFSLLIYISIYL